MTNTYFRRRNRAITGVKQGKIAKIRACRRRLNRAKNRIKGCGQYYCLARLRFGTCHYITRVRQHDIDMSFADIAQRLRDVHFWYNFAERLDQSNVRTMLEQHPLYSEINHDNLAELLRPYMQAFLQNDTFFWEFEYQLDPKTTIFYEGLCYWMYGQFVKIDGFMSDVMQIVAGDEVHGDFLHDIPQRHARMLEAKKDRFTTHEALIANDPTLHAHAYYLSNVQKEPSCNDARTNIDIKHMLVGHWDEEQTYKLGNNAAAVAATTKGLAASDNTPGAAVPAESAAPVPPAVPAESAAPVPPAVPAESAPAAPAESAPAESAPAVPAESAAPAAPLKPVSAPTQVETAPAAAAAQTDPVANNKGNAGDTNKLSKKAQKKKRQEEAERQNTLQRLRGAKSAPYGSDTDDSECSELEPTPSCHDSSVVSPRIKAVCDFMKRQHAVAQDAEVRYFASS